MPPKSRGIVGSITIRNIGGISSEHVDLARGVNVLAGPNATNRTSFLKAVAAGLGSENVSLKGDATEGRVELHVDGERYERTIREVDGSLVFEGSSPVDEDDRDVAELFGYLFERNRARQAIRQGDDLRSVVMDPVDTEQINSDIDRLQGERARKERELEAIDSLETQLPSLRERRDELTDRIDSLETDIAETEAEIDAADGSVEDEEERAQLEAKLSEQQSKRAELDDVDSKIETTEEAITHLETDLDDARAGLADVAAVDESTLADTDAELSRLRDQLARKETMMSELQNIIQFNRDYIDGDTTDSLATLTSADGTDAPSEALVTDDEIVCWTCGSPTTRSGIAETVERLQAVHEDLYEEREQLQQRIAEQKDRKAELENRTQRRSQLEDDISEITTQLEQHRETLSRLEDRQTRLTAELDDLSAEIERLQRERDDTVAELQRELHDLERELADCTDERASVVEEISDIESEVERREDIEAEIGHIRAQIEELRNQVDRIERQVVDEFNEHMDAVLSVLAYENVERVWLERRVADDGPGATEFDLHVIRSDEGGAPYEDVIGNLSESEREVTGLVFALAGYLVYEVHEKAPFMLLDSLEAIDSSRIAALIDYLRDHAPNIVVALLEADAAALDGEYTHLTRRS